MSNILVIGGAGYIGSHVVLELLQEDYQVTVYDNLSSGRQINLFSEAEFVHGDIQDKPALKKLFGERAFDGVIHLASLKAAGESMKKPNEYSHQNISGSLNVLEAVTEAKVKNFVFSSTAAVYGIPEYLPLDEDHPVSPINYYGFTKLQVEQHLQWYHQLKGLKFVSLRYFNAAGYDPAGRVKGLEQSPANLIPVIMEFLCGMRNQFNVFGTDYPTTDGTCIRDYIHVSDLASAHLKAIHYLENGNQELIANLGTGKGYSVLDVINMAEEVTGKKLNYTVAPRRKGDPIELYSTMQRAGNVLEWKPDHSDLKTIVESTWNIYNNRLSNSSG